MGSYWKVTIRKSNIELLRILAMCMIVAHHIMVHCVNLQLTDPSSIAKLGNGYFNYPIFFQKLWLVDLGTLIGPVGNAIFILISGYFLVKRENNIDFFNLSKKLLGQFAFATIILILVSFVISYMMVGELYTFQGLISIFYFNDLAWFIGYYFVVVLIGKLILNAYLMKLNQKQFLEVLGIILVLFSLNWTGNLLEGFVPGFRTLCTGLFLYALGGYIAKFNPVAKVSVWKLLLILVFMATLVIISTHNIRSVAIAKFVASGVEGDYIQTIPSYWNYHIIVVITGIIIFELFRRLPMGSNSLINYLGKSTFMVYLIHDNDLFYSLWNRTDWILLLHESSVKFCGNVLLWIVAIFGIGILLYAIYGVLEKNLFKSLSRPSVMDES